jgi:hypothetical protein
MGWKNIFSNQNDNPNTIEEAEENQEKLLKNVVKNQNNDKRKEVKKMNKK